jgi:Fe-S-cluster containining protein
MERLSEYLDLPPHAFREIYVRTLRDGTASLREKVNGNCIFFKNKKECMIYDLRPRQCRTWPFWRNVIRSPESWEKEAKCCKGMNRGPVYSREVIGKISENDGTRGNIIPGGKL